MDKTQHLAETVPVLLRTSQINSTDLWAKHTGLFWSTGHQVVGPERPERPEGPDSKDSNRGFLMIL